MKPNELRIGNWVEQPNNGVTRVTAILNDLQIKTETGYIDKYCRPIPLTEEWLLNFGFRLGGDRFDKEASNGLFRIWSLGLIHETYHTNRIGDDMGDMELKHVHQLQNLYFALTGEELTLNEKQDA